LLKTNLLGLLSSESIAILALLFYLVKCHYMLLKESNMSNQSNWLYPKEAGEILGVTRNTLKGLVRKGILPAYTIDGVVGIRFKRPEVEALIKRVEPEQAKAKKPAKPKRSATRKTL
jgi:excisionase family DNA binding protein